MPPVVVPVRAGVAPKASVSEGVEHSSTAGAKVGDNLDSLSGVAGEREDPGASGKSQGDIMRFLCPARLLCPHFVSQNFCMM